MFIVTTVLNGLAAAFVVIAISMLHERWQLKRRRSDETSR